MHGLFDSLALFVGWITTQTEGRWVRFLEPLAGDAGDAARVLGGLVKAASVRYYHLRMF